MVKNRGPRLGVVTVTAAVLMVLTGCVSGAHSHFSPSASPTASPTPAPTPAVTPAPRWPATAVHLECAQVMSAPQIYDFNPNYVAVSGPPADPFSMSERVLQLGGLDCYWVNETSGDLIMISVVSPASTDLSALERAAALTGYPVPGYARGAATAYFTEGAQGGRAEIFVGHLWIVVGSGDFTVPADSEPLVDVIVANLE